MKGNPVALSYCLIRQRLEGDPWFLSTLETMVSFLVSCILLIRCWNCCDPRSILLGANFGAFAFATPDPKEAVGFWGSEGSVTESLCGSFSHTDQTHAAIMKLLPSVQPLTYETFWESVCLRLLIVQLIWLTLAALFKPYQGKGKEES